MPLDQNTDAVERSEWEDKWARCPRCGSARTELRRRRGFLSKVNSSIGCILLGLLLLPITILLLPLMWISPKTDYACKDCGYTWNAADRVRP